ncbi:unnamed protein product [Brugia pahangi]|uniref:RRM domain-containing protein n=1 Tax=Brugia pahangi TaxID=6280 RepID=A0A0N4T518_BRUPA|nr:unnamed protein product [Brugia pahangi]
MTVERDGAMDRFEEMYRGRCPFVAPFLRPFRILCEGLTVIGYTSRESATKALEKMSGKEVDGQTVQVCDIVHYHCASRCLKCIFIYSATASEVHLSARTKGYGHVRICPEFSRPYVAAVEEKQAGAGGKHSETTKETERSPSEERSRSRTNSGSSAASGDEEKKNGSVDGNEHSGVAAAVTDSHKKAKNGEEHTGNAVTANNTRNNRKRTSGANDDGEKNGDDSETSNDAVTPELKKKKSDTEETETTEVDSTATRCLVYRLSDNKSLQQCCYLAGLISLALIFHRLSALLQVIIGQIHVNFTLFLKKDFH